MSVMQCFAPSLPVVSDHRSLACWRTFTGPDVVTDAWPEPAGTFAARLWRLNLAAGCCEAPASSHRVEPLTEYCAEPWDDAAAWTLLFALLESGFSAEAY